MAISRFSTSSVAQGLPKYQKLYDGVTTLFDSDYELIERVTVGSGGSSSVSFSSIPSTYRHLQVRLIARSDRTAGVDLIGVRMNGDSSGNYSNHLFKGDGSSTSVDFDINATRMNIQRLASDNLNASIFSSYVVDILDYANTNKYKTIRYIAGYDANGSGQIVGGSGAWRSTSAVTSLSFQNLDYSSNYKQYTTFALYGIKGV